MNQPNRATAAPEVTRPEHESVTVGDIRVEFISNEPEPTEHAATPEQATTEHILIPPGPDPEMDLVEYLQRVADDQAMIELLRKKMYVLPPEKSRSPRSTNRETAIPATATPAEIIELKAQGL